MNWEWRKILLTLSLWRNPLTKLYPKRDSQRHCVPDLQHEGAGKRRALYWALTHFTGDPPAAFW